MYGWRGQRELATVLATDTKAVRATREQSLTGPSFPQLPRGLFKD